MSFEKKYIFLTFAVFGIGGTQIYLRNKKRFLENNGWSVRALITEPKGDNELVINDLSPFTDCIFPEMMINPNLFSRKEKKRILDRMCGAIGDITPDSVIESNVIQTVFWGELLAERLGIRNFIFLIQEDYRIGIRSYLRFLKFKMDRGELAVNISRAIDQLFDGFCQHPDGKELTFIPICVSTIEDGHTALTDSLPRADYVIAGVGRVSKPFVYDAVCDIAAFTRSHPDKSFLLLLIGWSSDEGDYDRIRRAAAEGGDLKVFITGPLFPIPRSLLDAADVFVSTAGAAMTTADEGYVTVSIDSNDHKPIGILGRTTSDAILRREGDTPPELSVLLEEILFEHKYRHTGIRKTDYDRVMTDEFTRQVDFLSKASGVGDYYDIGKIKPAMGLRVKHFIDRLMARKHEPRS